MRAQLILLILLLSTLATSNLSSLVDASPRLRFDPTYLLHKSVSRHLQKTNSTNFGANNQTYELRVTIIDYTLSPCASNLPTPRISLDNLPLSAYRVKSRPGRDVPLTRDLDIRPDESYLVRVVENKLLTPVGYERDIRQYTFDLGARNITYEMGDYLAVYPEAPVESVMEVCELLDYDPNTELRVTSYKHARNTIPTQLNMRQLFSRVLDIMGKPSQSFYGNLALFATDPAERELLELMGSNLEEGKALVQQRSDEKYNFIRVLKEFPSARPPLHHLIDMIPNVVPRLYSISSSPLMHPTQPQLTIVHFPGGLASSYLRDLPAGSLVAVVRQKGRITFPKDETIPLVMVGLGTGIAPWRGFTQTRVVLKKLGIPVGPSWLFYGARSGFEHFYENEFTEYEKEGSFTLRTAFGKTAGKRVYVQDHMVEAGAELWQMMKDKESGGGGGSFLLCGLAGRAVIDMEAAWVKILTKHGEMSEGAAREKIQGWRVAGRYVEEVVLN